MKDIKDFEGLYGITSCGRVYSYISLRFLTPAKTKDGYLRVGLYKDGKRYSKLIHRLVAEAYIPNPENKPYVNHINGNKEENYINNLEWCTPAENNQHAIGNNLRNNKRPTKSVHDRTTGFIYESCSAAARANDGIQQRVWDCCNGILKTYKGHEFEYVD